MTQRQKERTRRSSPKEGIATAGAPLQRSPSLQVTTPRAGTVPGKKTPAPSSVQPQSGFSCSNHGDGHEDDIGGLEQSRSLYKQIRPCGPVDCFLTRRRTVNCPTAQAWKQGRVFTKRPEELAKYEHEGDTSDKWELVTLLQYTREEIGNPIGQEQNEHSNRNK